MALKTKAYLDLQPAVPTSRIVPVDDDIFFHKGQLRKGAVLQCFGRRDPGSYWEITKIMSRWMDPKTMTRRTSTDLREVPEVHYLGDDIYFRRVGSLITRNTTFATLSYSAIWRLAKPAGR